MNVDSAQNISENKLINCKSKVFGAGLRAAHYSSWHEITDLPTLEIMADNYMFLKGGPGLYHMRRITERTQTVVHGVGLNLATAYGLDKEYCYLLKSLCDSIQPKVVSDHLCFSATPSHNSFDLLPIPFTPVTLNLLCENVNIIQDILKRQFSIENISSYISYKESTYTEIEFLNEICKRTGCGVLLDVNNIYVSAMNHGYKPFDEIKKINPTFVNQYHMAGHTKIEDYLFDTHDSLVCEEVWDLMKWALKNIGDRPAIIERDDDTAPFSEIIYEINHGNSLI